MASSCWGDRLADRQQVARQCAGGDQPADSGPTMVEANDVYGNANGIVIGNSGTRSPRSAISISVWGAAIWFTTMPTPAFRQRQRPGGRQRRVQQRGRGDRPSGPGRRRQRRLRQLRRHPRGHDHQQSRLSQYQCRRHDVQRLGPHHGQRDLLQRLRDPRQPHPQRRQP